MPGMLGMPDISGMLRMPGMLGMLGMPGFTDARDARDARYFRDARDAKDARYFRDARDARDAEDARDARDVRDAREDFGSIKSDFSWSFFVGFGVFHSTRRVCLNSFCFKNVKDFFLKKNVMERNDLTLLFSTGIDTSLANDEFFLIESRCLFNGGVYLKSFIFLIWISCSFS